VVQLAIVIPVLDSLEGLESTLLSVLENRPASAEVIVVFNRAYDDPYDLKSEIQFIEAPRRAGLAEALNLAVAACRAEIIHVLRSGAEVSQTWIDAVVPMFSNPEIGSVSPLVLDKTDGYRVVSAGLTYQRGGSARHLGQGRPSVGTDWAAMVPDGPGRWSAFYRKSALEAAGLFHRAMPDAVVAVDMALSLCEAGYRCALQPKSVTYVDSVQLANSKPSALKQGWALEKLFWRWAPAAGWGRSLSAHAALLAGRFFQCAIKPGQAMEMLGRFAALCQIPIHKRHWRVPRGEINNSAQPLAEPHFELSHQFQDHN
jgi:hypothetical protein